MPIIYDKSKGWSLNAVSDEEKEALLTIAVEQIQEAFGEEVARQILEDAAKYHLINKEESQAGVVKTYDAPTRH